MTIYHDETTAQRLKAAIRLHHIYAARDRRFLTLKLERLMDETAALLATEEFYAGKNNHGMFQSKALRDYAVYADWADDFVRSEYLGTSLKRISEYFKYSFTSEGVHIEHSPSYHLMVSRHIHEHSQFVRAAFGKCPPELGKSLKDAEMHAIHCIQPNGVFLPLSDSAQVSLLGEKNNVFASEEFAYATSVGKFGRVPNTRTLSEPESGYFFHRTSWGNSSAGYLAFVAAYNGAYHKHSDDLHLYLWKYGYELLTESGPFGYQMENPMVKFAFSQHAHNCVVVDHKSLPRHDRKYDRVKMGVYNVDESGDILISASNSRFTDTVHKRSLYVSDDLQEIRVEDQLDSESHHTYSLIWNFGQFLKISIFDNHVIGCINSVPVIRLDFSGPMIEKIIHFSGRGGARPRGWRFPKFGHKHANSQIQVIFEGQSEKIITKITTYDRDAERLKKPVPSHHLSELSVQASSDTASTTPGPVADNQMELNALFGTLQHQDKVMLFHLPGKSTRAVIRLYHDHQLLHEHRGLVKNFAWSAEQKGKYRARIFPKGINRTMKPFTTDWVIVS
ncbi:heparinase II/III domain-containing protein [Glutamicibacter ardleyensis]